MNNKIINLIVAHDTKYGISKFGSIPWKYKDDISFFTKVTKNVTNWGMYNALIMGSNTYHSFNHSKDNKRKIYVVSSKNINYSNAATISKTVPDAILKCNNDPKIEKIFICSKIGYQYVINNNIVDKMYVTQIKNDHQCDNHIPDYSNLGTTIKNSILSNDKITITEQIKQSSIINCAEKNYLLLLKEILEKGNYRKSRNCNTISLFSKSLSFDLADGFPLLTTKNMYFKGISAELINLFLKGKTDSNILTELGVNIWSKNTSAQFLSSRGLDYRPGEMGPMYGYQWRYYGLDYNNRNHCTNLKSFDQLENVINLIQNDHTSRRIMMTTYNPLDSLKCVLDPCHGIITQFYVSIRNGIYMLDCQMYQRSADMFLGMPFNIASYALLMHIICILCRPMGNSLHPGILTINIGDAHIYESHLQSVKTQIQRTPLQFPQLHVSECIKHIIDQQDKLINVIDHLDPRHFKIVNYLSYSDLKEEMVA